MPISITNTLGGTNYVNPFIGGPRDFTHLKLDVSTLTTNEVDANGYLKPGVALDMDGARVGGETFAGTALAAAVAGNTGNGALTMDVTTPLVTGAQNGVYRVTIIEPAANGGTYEVEDPHGVLIGTAAIGGTFNNQVKFVLADGGTDFVAGDQFTITVTVTAGGTANATVYGVTAEAIKIVDAGPTNTTLLADTSDPLIAVATAGLINRDIAEDNLGRAYTAAELAGFVAAGSRIGLTTT